MLTPGTGKVEHLSAKILWIALSQISTAFNVADFGAKVLSSKRLKILLRDIGIFDDDGANPIQAEERRGGDDRNLNQQMMHVLHFSWALSLPLALPLWFFRLVNVQLMFQLALVRQKFMMMITQGWST